MRDKKLNLRFRQSRPADVEQAVPLIYSAGVENFDYMFRQGSAGPLNFLGRAFTEGSGFFGCRVHTVVELEDRVVGIGASYNGAQFDRLAVGTTKQVFQFYGLARCWSVFLRAASVNWLRRRVCALAHKTCAHCWSISSSVSTALLTRV